MAPSKVTTFDSTSTTKNGNELQEKRTIDEINIDSERNMLTVKNCYIKKCILCQYCVKISVALKYTAIRSTISTVIGFKFRHSN